MLPDCYVCSSCHERFDFKFREAYYYTGAAPADKQIADADLLWVNVRPAWCMDCECVCVAEDIAPLRAFEGAYGAARAGQPVEYPAYTAYMKAPDALRELGDQLRWRMGRRHAARALCCGGLRYQWMDVAQPLLKHAECDFGFIEPRIHIGSGCGRGPGVSSPANIRLYDPEGELIGQLTWRKEDGRIWEIEPMRYPPPVADD
ncbi:hypothetical protein IV454_01580 [Massilia antarctica]|uniref:Uncharacterized protein n=1 Tax=Massilia antarctica TaxID=2765360 RepID=A0AA48WEI1_9BURK|nr:hypothetical protein [Massilia antarctica]QPI50353.1 hypothetical protein IV454_01580 [Massilia antarctica]